MHRNLFFRLTTLIFGLSALFNLRAEFYTAVKNQNDTIIRVGKAYSKKDQQLLFVEKSKLIFNGNQIQEAFTEYFRADTLYATKLYKTQNFQKREYQLKYTNGNFESVSANDLNYTIEVKHGNDLKKDELKSEDRLYFDEDLINSIFSRKDYLDLEDNFDISILVPERVTYFTFIVEKISEKNNIECYDFYPDNLMIRAFFPDFKFYFKGDVLQKISGLSQIGTMLGHPEIDITFSYPNE